MNRNKGIVKECTKQFLEKNNGDMKSEEDISATKCILNETLAKSK